MFSFLPEEMSMAKTLFIASGKGGVGKSTVTANLGILLAGSGASVVIVDTDLGLRSQDLFLSLGDQVVYDLMDVVRRDCTLDQALLESSDMPRLRLLPASQFTRAKELEAKSLRKILRYLENCCDYLLIDCPAGIERGLRNVVNTGIAEAIIIATPDDLCIRDAERVADLLRKKGLDSPHLIMNRLQSSLIRTGEMPSAQSVSMLLDLPLLGEIPEDPAVYRAQLQHSAVSRFDCEARNALVRIARRIMGEDVPLPSYGTSRISFFRRLFHAAPAALKEVSSLDSH